MLKCSVDEEYHSCPIRGVVNGWPRPGSLSTTPVAQLVGYLKLSFWCGWVGKYLVVVVWRSCGGKRGLSSSEQLVI